MNSDNMVISKGNLKKGQLKDKIALITGAGGGIGYETARALIWLGAKVIIAEIDIVKGKRAMDELNREFGVNCAVFCHTDIGSEKSVRKLANKVLNIFGHIDIIINNATVAPIGSVHEVGIKEWDLSYGVNLRGPVLLISQFLPYMLEKNSGIIAMVPSSGAAPFMGAYEVFKTAQVELANTLAAELENTDIITYSIGPGIVKTDTALKSIEKLAPLYGKSVEEFFRMSENVLITTEEAGAGFAASAALAEKYRGLEISSIQALIDAGISITEKTKTDNLILSDEDKNKIELLFTDVKKTFVEQINGWSSRPIFERQWLIRDFKKLMGASTEYFLEIIKEFEYALESGGISMTGIKKLPLEKISSYYKHQIELLRGYEKDKNKVSEYTEIMNGWIKSVEELQELVKDISSR